MKTLLHLLCSTQHNRGTWCHWPRSRRSQQPPEPRQRFHHCVVSLGMWSVSWVHLASFCIILLFVAVTSWNLMESWDLHKRYGKKTRPCGPACMAMKLLAKLRPTHFRRAYVVKLLSQRSYVLNWQSLYCLYMERLLPHACNRFQVRTPRSKSGSDAMLKHQQSRLLSKAASKWHLQAATATAFPLSLPLEPAIISTQIHEFFIVLCNSIRLLFSQATECRLLPQLTSCKWQSSPHRANWSHDQNGRRHVRLSNSANMTCEYDMWTGRRKRIGQNELVTPNT